MPYAIINNGSTESSHDIHSLLLKQRIIILNGEINKVTADAVTTQLIYLDSINDDDITIYINSEGGCVMSGLAIYDIMNVIKSDVSTVVIGEAASMGSFLAAAGKKGKRFAMPNSEFMFHQVSAGMGGTVADMNATFKQTKYLNKKLRNILIKNSKLSKDEFKKFTQRDWYITPKKALKYGFIDGIKGE